MKITKMGHKAWLAIIDQWMEDNGFPTYDWDEITRLEGGSGATFFKSMDEVLAHPDTFIGKWYATEQNFYEHYLLPDYVYSAYHCFKIMSSGSYAAIGKREVGNVVVDVGGTAFTAWQLLKHGVSKVLMTNFEDCPQSDFAKYLFTKFDMNAEIISKDEIPPDSTLACIEYFEHFRNVDEELNSLLEKNPAKIYERAPFCSLGYGHHCPVIIGGVSFSKSRGSRAAFHKLLASRGYVGEKIKVWNRYPFVFVRKDYS